MPAASVLPDPAVRILPTRCAFWKVRELPGHAAQPRGFRTGSAWSIPAARAVWPPLTAPALASASWPRGFAGQYRTSRAVDRETSHLYLLNNIGFVLQK